jgi:DNA primase catalytic core
VSASGSDYKTQVLAAIDIVELIGQTVSLKRAGKDYKGLCPFHQEKTGSFHVSPTKQFFYCYGCKAGGNAIDFVIKRDRVEFIDALRTLGEKAGIPMPKHGGAGREKASERQVLLDACSAACSFFEKSLAQPEWGAAARAYLDQRGFNAESVKRFQIGLAVDAWDALLRSAVGRKFTPQQLAMAGLVKPRNTGDGYYDTFRNRLMFPIRDENGRVIAFGGRVMPGSPDPAKYLNSPETPLFSKGRSVFGLDVARQRIVETRTAVVVEGYTDVVIAHQYGVSNVVSVLGTAMTEPHVTTLRRFADRIVLLFDADTAGDLAVDRAVGLFLTQPVEIAIASMPADVDPDEFLLEHGAAGFDKMLAEAADALTYKWKQLARRFNDSGNNLTGQQKAVEEYLRMLADARGSGPVDAARWHMALARVSRLTEIPRDELNRLFGRPKNTPPRGPRGPGPTADGGRGDSPGQAAIAPARPVAPRGGRRFLSARDRAERWILGILLMEPHRWDHVQRTISVTDFTDGTRRRLAELYWQHQRDEGEPVFNEFLGLLRDGAPGGTAPRAGPAADSAAPAAGVGSGPSGEDLIELAIEAVDEVEALADVELTLAGALAHLESERRLREDEKLLPELRRTSEERAGEEVEIDLLKRLQDTARRRTDLRRA